MSAEYAFWKDSLDGRKPEIHADHPQPGFYRTRTEKSAPFVPVAIWDEGDTLRCKVGYDDLFVMRDPADAWVWCGGNPVTYATYQVAARTHQWPDQASPNAALLDEAEDLIASCEDGGELEDLSRRIEVARKRETAAHLEAKRQVDAKFKKFSERIVARMKQLKQQEQAAA